MAHFLKTYVTATQNIRNGNTPPRCAPKLTDVQRDSMSREEFVTDFEEKCAARGDTKEACETGELVQPAFAEAGAGFGWGGVLAFWIKMCFSYRA